MIVEWKSVNEKTWNGFLGEADIRGTIFQSTFWAEYLRKTFNDNPIYIASLDKKGNIQGLLLAIESCFGKYPSLTLSRTRGFVFGRLYKHIVSPFFHRILPFVFWEDGPIILSQPSTIKSSDKTVYQEILRKIVERAQKRGCYIHQF